ncbi:MAG: hypothetical protein L6R35_002185 [Caloplaca aegaea]|nr:MAG: hypothetical protein L6R35_002185 [Caloplaca aegaea]
MHNAFRRLAWLDTRDFNFIMDIMAGWLSRTIQRDLSEAMELASGQKANSMQDKYEDDGSNLRVRASKPGVVQIIKWERFKEPFVVTLSDSAIYMKATISSSAAAEHEKRTRKRITDGTLGNIIQLLQVEIVATPFGPRSSRITLLVSKFKVIGSDKSSQFGVPRPFEVTQDGQQLLEKLEKLSSSRASTRRISRAPSLSGSDQGTPPIPRVNDVPPVEAGCLGSQQLFSQIPALSASSGATQAAAKKPLIGLRVPRDASGLHEQRGDNKPMNQAEALLQMMQARNPRNRSICHERKVEEQERLLNSKYLPGMNADAQADDPSKAVEVVSTDQPQPEHPVAVSVIGSATPIKEDPSSRKSLITKIRSRDVKIPNDQQKLLDQEHAWLPPEPGRRGPIANVPIAVLQEITRRVEQLRAEPVVTKIPPLSEQSPKQMGASHEKDESDENIDTDAESLVPSAAWPPSSPVLMSRELPPDSSMEMVDNSADEEHMLTSPLPQASVDLDVNKSDVITSAASFNDYATPAVRHEVSRLTKLMSPTGTISRRTNGSSPPTSSVDTPITREDISLPAAAVQDATMTSPESDLEGSEYELETAVPLNLNQPAASATDGDPIQEIPATAYEQKEPVLQVKRTPYVCGGIHGDRLQSQQQPSAYESCSSPSKRRRVDSEGTPQRLGFRAFDDDPHALKPTSNHQAKSPQSPWGRSPTCTSGVEETFLAPAAYQEARPAPGSPTSPHPIMSLSSSEQRPQAPEPEEPEASQAVRACGDQPANGRDQPPILSPYVTKRHKVYRTPIAFKFTQEEYPKEDPSITARKHREEFFASRKNSRSTAHTNPSEISSRERENPVDHAFQDSSRARDVSISCWKTSKSQEPLQILPRRSSSPCNGQSSPKNGLLQKFGRVEEPSSLSARVSSSSPHRVSNPIAGRASIAFSAPDIGRHAPVQMPIITSIEHPDLLLAQSVSPNLHSVSTKLEGLSSTETSQKTNNSGQAQSLPELMTPALSIIDLPQHASSSPKMGAAPQAASAKPDLFIRFRATYPDYLGTKEHFLGMCKRIEQLSQANRMEHKSLWDDFIVRHLMDYPLYTQRCIENAEDAKHYEQFYRDEIDEPRYTKRVVQPATLAQVLLPLDILALAGQGSVSPVKVESSSAHFGTQGRPMSIHSVISTLVRSKAGSRLVRNKLKPILTLAKMQSSLSISQMIEALRPHQHHRPHLCLSRLERSLDKNTSMMLLDIQVLKAGEIGERTLLSDAQAPQSSIDRGPQDIELKRTRSSRKIAQGMRASASSSKERPKQHSVEVDEWWKDDNTPFREYTRLYQSISPGKGNAWAVGKSHGKGKCEPTGARYGDISGVLLADVMSWRL